jgi:biopolymer transport protein ExbD
MGAASRMGSRFHAKHGMEEDNEVDMTPMIDCIMLLLIFFMTTSKMNSQGLVQTPEARFGGSVDPKFAIVVSLFEGKGGKDTMVVLGDGQPDVGKRPIAKNENEIREYIRTGMRERKITVVLKGEERVPNRDMNRVARIVGEFEALKLNIGVRDATLE